MNNQAYKNTPLWDSSLPLKERLDYLVSAVSLEEKMDLVCHKLDIPRLGITSSGLGGEAAHGIEARRDQVFSMDRKPQQTTSFPQPIGMSATWDPALIEQVGTAVGNEARVIHQREGSGGICRWAPTIDMERDPRWGRTEEAYGEDPFLTGEMASAYVLGMRGRDPYYIRCGSVLKHFYGNNTEKDRSTISASIDTKNKKEYYYEPFRRVITKGRAEGMMTAYNKINGVPCMVLDEVQKVVKDTWGLPGHVVTDGGDVEQTVDYKHYGSYAKAIADGLKAGIDSFTDNQFVVRRALRQAYEEELITEADLDRAIRNVFSTRIRLGTFDALPKNPYHAIPDEALNSTKHQELSLKAASEAVVLLKNDGILPLSKEEESLAVIGPLSDEWYKDWYCGIPPYMVTPLDGIKNYIPEDRIHYEDGLPRIRISVGTEYLGISAKQTLILTDKTNAETFLWTDWGFGSSTLYSERLGVFLSTDDDNNIITAEKEEAFGWFIKESYRIEAGGGNDYQIHTWNGRSLYVDENKEVRPCESESALRIKIEILDDGIEKAKRAAAAASTAVVVLGTNPMINSKEEIDRTDITLPPYQEQLIQELYAVNPNIVLILVTNYPHSICWEQEHIPGVLMSASGSMELGNGIADIVFGKTSPAGRLNMTWYRSVDDLPDINEYDIRKGKRTYQYFDKEALYPFGYGLTYSSFEYTDLSVILKDYTTLEVAFKVKNIGNVISDEVAQLYVRQLDSRTVRPFAQLKGFQRLKAMAPGETRTVTLTIPTEELVYFDVITGSMVLEQGTYQFMAGPSSKELPLSAELFLNGEVIGSRNTAKRIPAEYYDEYEELYLDKGTRGMPAVTPMGSAGYAIYKNMLSETAVSTISLDVYAVTAGKITLTADGTFLAEKSLEPSKKFTEVLLDVSDIPVGKEFTLRLDIEGSVRVSSFLFEAK